MLSQSINGVLEFPISLTISVPAQIPNWSIIADITSSLGKVRRSPLQVITVDWWGGEDPQQRSRSTSKNQHCLINGNYRPGWSCFLQQQNTLGWAEPKKVITMQEACSINLLISAYSLRIPDHLQYIGVLHQKQSLCSDVLWSYSTTTSHRNVWPLLLLV